MRPIEVIPGMVGGGIKENDRGRVNSTMIYCKKFCKCHNVPPSTTIIKIKYKKINAVVSIVQLYNTALPFILSFSQITHLYAMCPLESSFWVLSICLLNHMGNKKDEIQLYFILTFVIIVFIFSYFSIWLSINS
jgi:hypothetical protein